MGYLTLERCDFHPLAYVLVANSDLIEVTRTSFSTSSFLASALSARDLSSATSLLASLSSSSSSSVFRHRPSESLASFASRLFSFSSSSSRDACLRYISVTASPSGLKGGRFGDLRAFIVGERGACEIEVRRKDDDRILDCRLKDGWRPCGGLEGVSNLSSTCVVGVSSSFGPSGGVS